MRTYHDFGEQVRFLIRSKIDVQIEKAHDLEVRRAEKFFMNHLLNHESFYTSYHKTVSSYGLIIADIATNNIQNFIATL